MHKLWKQLSFLPRAAVLISECTWLNLSHSYVLPPSSVCQLLVHAAPQTLFPPGLYSWVFPLFPGSTEMAEWSCWCWIGPFSGVICLEVYHFIMSLPIEIEIALYKLEIGMAIFPRKNWFTKDRTCICIFHKSFLCKAWLCPTIRKRAFIKPLFSQCILIYNIL